MSGAGRTSSAAENQVRQLTAVQHPHLRVERFDGRRQRIAPLGVGGVGVGLLGVGRTEVQILVLQVPQVGVHAVVGRLGEGGG